MICNKNIIITGGFGFIGSHLADRLAQDNYLTIIDDGSSGDPDNIRHLPRDRVAVIHGSVAGLNLKKIFRGNDYVFHEAAMASVPGSIADPVACNRTNVDGTLRVLDAARYADIKKVIFASSSSVYGDAEIMPTSEDVPLHPLSPYAVSKATGEMYCRVFREIYGLPAIALRYFNVFGPRQSPGSQYAAVIPKFIAAMLHGDRPVIYGDGEQSRDFTYVRHVVEANVLACEHGLSGAYNVSCGRRITLNSLVAVINDIMGTDIKPIYADARPGDIRHSMADISRARIFRFNPKGDLKAEIMETIGWFNESMEMERFTWKSSSSAIQSTAR